VFVLLLLACLIALYVCLCLFVLFAFVCVCVFVGVFVFLCLCGCCDPYERSSGVAIVKHCLEDCVYSQSKGVLCDLTRGIGNFVSCFFITPSPKVLKDSK
jgi:hypothetical protein